MGVYSHKMRGGIAMQMFNAGNNKSVKPMDWHEYGLVLLYAF